jgi:aryl-alcohol dehydrogenase-like predicted oxidoreductase
MNISSWKDLKLSRLTLGTVQFGLPYGVANRVGKPSYADVIKILAVALDGGVNCFDTAAAYATSEEVLGKALHQLNALDNCIIFTKVSPLDKKACDDPQLARAAIERSVDESRRRLRMDTVPAVLFHCEADARYMDVLDNLVTRGWIRYAGISCGNLPDLAKSCVERERPSVLQLPTNLLDRRHRDSGIFSWAASQGIAVFIRSVYLQGLLLMDEDQIPTHLKAVLPARRQLTRIADAAGIPLAELALRHAITQDVTSVLVGVDNEQQMLDNLRVFRRGPLPADVTAAVEAIRPDLPAELVTPSMWP